MPAAGLAARAPRCGRAPSVRLAYGQRGWNAQPDGRLIRLGGVPLIGIEPLAAVAVEPRHRAEQAPGVRVLGRAEDLVGGCRTRRTLPPYITRMSSASSATTPRSWVMMMTARAELLLQVPDQVEDLRLHGHVERGGRLVGDQQLGVA